MVMAVTSTHTSRYAVGLAACAILALGGCAGQGSVEDAAAADAAERFAQDITADAQAACELLAPQTRVELEDSSEASCAEALPQQDIPDGGQVRRVEVYGKDAVVHLEEDTVFLARFDEGWRVTAAGCTPNGDRPYDCDVRGS
jgi:hypothetical protein